MPRWKAFHGCPDKGFVTDSIARNRTLAYLAQVALKALETGELEQRVEAMEAAVHGQSSRRNVFEFDPEPIRFPSEEVVK